jgi:hypothetical protein
MWIGRIRGMNGVEEKYMQDFSKENWGWRRWEDDIKMDIHEVGRGMEFRCNCWAVTKTLAGSIKFGEFLGFSRRSLLHGVVSQLQSLWLIVSSSDTIQDSTS